MNTMTIKHPETAREVKVRVWDITTREIGDGFASGKFRSAKDLSWDLLSQKHSVRAMERTEGGDSAANNFALNVLENALDWSLGLAVVRFIKDACAVKRCPRAFKVAASRKGDVFIIVARKDGTPVVFKY